MTSRIFRVIIAMGISVAMGQENPGAPAGAAEDARDIPPGDAYLPGPDSKPQPGVPAGSAFEFELESSRIFPGTRRTITVYVPAQYRPDTPACVYVNLDGLNYRTPTVFDNLIHKKQMPVTIGIGVAPGETESARPPDNPRHNRSFEFDSLNDRLARFLLEEVFPAVEKRTAPDGRPLRLSDDPNDRAIGGGSTGAIGAFTVAWERPDAFRRVFTSIGTFVGMRGGDRYPVLVRKTEPKPLRVFMQDGSNDQWRGGPHMGDWWMSNQLMELALRFAGYEVEHVWGTGGHSGRHAKAIFPDAMRWLWKDWPEPVRAGESQHPVLRDILIPGENWKTIAEAKARPGTLRADAQGQPHFVGDEGIFRLGVDGAVEKVRACPPDAAFAFGTEGRLFVAEGGRILVCDAKGESRLLAEGINAGRALATAEGFLYVASREPDAAKLWLVSPSGEKRILDEGFRPLSVLAQSPDGLWFFAAEGAAPRGFSWKVEPDGALRYREPYYDLETPDGDADCGAAAAAFDRDGRLFVASRMGIQALDRNGRVTALLPLPGNTQATGLAFGGADFSTLFVTDGEKIYCRKMKTRGLPPAAQSLPLPSAGKG